MEPFLRGEEICHPPQFPVPEVRLPIGAVGRMGTGSSTDLTVAGSPRLPSFSERSYGEQLRYRHFPREHMGNSSVAVIFRENIWGTAPLPAGLFSFFGGGDDLGIPWGASVGCELYVWGKYRQQHQNQKQKELRAIRMGQIRHRYGAEMESGPLPDGIARRTG